MKIPPNRVEAFLAAPDGTIRAVLVYGPDGGLVRERLNRLTRSIVPDPTDPFRIVTLSASVLRDDPARLADEAAAIAMTGGRRVLRIDDAGDVLARLLTSFLDDPAGDALILVEGGELGPRSSLRKLFENAANAAALPCYGDDEDKLATIIRDTLQGHGLRADRDTLLYLTQNLGGDRMQTRSELDKLVLYMGGPGSVGLADAAACIGDGSALSMDDLILAATDGDHTGTQNRYERLVREGTSPIAILRLLGRHVQRLHLAAGLMAKGASPDKALAALRPPPHFRAQPRMRGQLSWWNADRLGTALSLILAAESDCKKTGMPAEDLCGRLLIQIAQAAAAGRRKPPGRNG